ncbi:MAG: 2-isopropylmalate synthase, partial [Rhodospirillales bacterium]|nr:2-isopropylmalate synthase [Rhodospirillales bacterium]
VVRGHDRIKLTALSVSTGMAQRPTATLQLDVDGEDLTGVAIGDGAVDATFNAIRQAFPHEVQLKLYAVQSVTGGTDAQARVTVRFEENGKLVDGQGSDTCTIVASARAYVHALNKLLVKRERTEPAALSA